MINQRGKKPPGNSCGSFSKLRVPVSAVDRLYNIVKFLFLLRFMIIKYNYYYDDDDNDDDRKVNATDKPLRNNKYTYKIKYTHKYFILIALVV